MTSRKGSIASNMSQTSSRAPSVVSESTATAREDNSDIENTLQPCAASSRNFLYALGSSVLCLRHDSLDMERRFERHTEKVTILAVDSINPEQPRVVSIDESRNAIVWDLDSGDEIATYRSEDEITVATWMKNGNLVFGDSLGNIILFDPSRSEAITARTIFSPLTAIAPAADCRNFALGYHNGSILVAALAPAFTILHTLTTTSLSPSPIATLAWHASSSKQKSDMLACQTRAGDLRVWSVPKSIESEESARVVRVLKRPECNRRGNNWIGWSRNGRIVQYSEGASTIWDVRTKKVIWEPVPTLDNLAGISIYGPKGLLFTIGKDSTVQQFSLYPPALQSNVLQRPALPPPSPPVSLEGEKTNSNIGLNLHSESLHSDSEDYEKPLRSPASMRLKLRRSGNVPKPIDIQIIDQQQNSLGLTRDITGSASSMHSLSSVSSIQSGPSIHSSIHSLHSVDSHHSRVTDSRGRIQHTSFTSRGSLDHQPPEPSPATTISSSYSRSKQSTATPQPSPAPRFHPLRQEIQISPQVTAATQRFSGQASQVRELFHNVKTRMIHSDIQNLRFDELHHMRLSEEDKRREMLWTIFGWKGDIEELIYDELESVNARSLSALTLRMWIGDLDENSFSMLLGADFTVSGDWLFLALAGMGGQKAWGHVARAYVMKLLQRNEIHMAVMILLACGDKTDAVEVYVSHSMYIEATILTTLVWKDEWRRISALVRRWGEYARDNNDFTVSQRCFACVGDMPQPSPAFPPPNMMRERSNSYTKGSEEEHYTVQPLRRGMSVNSPPAIRTHLSLARNLSDVTPTQGRASDNLDRNSLRVVTSFGPPPEPVDPIKRSQTTDPSMGRRPKLDALTPVDPFWQQRKGAEQEPATAVVQRLAPFGLAPLVEASPISAIPIGKKIDDSLPFRMQRSPPPSRKKTPPQEKQQAVDPVQRYGSPANSLKISGPMEVRTSNGFGDRDPTASPPPHGQTPVQRGATPALRARTPAPRSTTPAPVTMGAPIPIDDLAIAPAPPPPPPPPAPPAATFGEHLSRQGSPTNGLPLRRGTPPQAGPIRMQSPPITYTMNNGMRTPPMTEPPRSHTAQPRMNNNNTSGLQISFQHSIDSVMNSEIQMMPQGPSLNQLRGHTRKPSQQRKTPPPVFVPRVLPLRQESSDKLDNYMTMVEKGNNRLFTGNHPAARDLSSRRRESPDRRRRGSPDRRRGGRTRDMSLDRGRTIEIKRTAAHMRSPSTPLPWNAQSALYRDEPEVVEVHNRFDDEPEPLTGRFYGDDVQDNHHDDMEDDEPRGRGQELLDDDRAMHWRSPSSPPAYGYTAQHDHYQWDPNDRIQDHDSDERYYTTSNSPPQPSRVPNYVEEQRGRRADFQPSYERSPSSPAIMGPQADFYRQMSEEVDREHEMQERNFHRPEPRRPRAESRGRAPRARSLTRQDMRRSRSEHGLRQWSDRLERGAMGPSPLSKEVNIRGLPSNPRAWQSNLRSDSPQRGHNERGRSPVSYHARNDSRDVSPSTRRRSPSPVRRRTPELAPAPPAPESYYSSAHTTEPMMAPAPPPPPTLPQSNFYNSPSLSLPEYESIPEPTHQQSDLANRRNQAPPTALNPLIRKFTPAPPLDSPPPLPMDLPVHPALQMHLDPTLPGGKKMSQKMGIGNGMAGPVRGVVPRNAPGPSGLGYGRSQDEIMVGIEEPREEMIVKESQRFMRSLISKNTAARNQAAIQQQQMRVVPDYEVDYGAPMQQRSGHGRQGSIGSGNHF